MMMGADMTVAITRTEHTAAALRRHAACSVDQEVPAHLYTAVAQVLAFVMALRRRGSGRGVHRNPMASTA